MVQAGDVKCDSNGDRSTSAEFIGVGEEHAMSFESRDISGLAAIDLVLNLRDKSQNGVCNFPN